MKKLAIFVFVLLIGGIAFAQDDLELNTLPSVNIRTLEGETFNTSNITNDGKPIIISF